ncbi:MULTISPECIES: anti-sigma factor domain-containing protein [Geobacillus thermoleovorans group]|uniref:anti-sigma factor domain-containing protein n=1 Tax=Geobacillus thermoleovorans TaxID=33941 RepID=UPI0010FD7FC5|nr:anti-sigma factor domain-containing protein [Geobacillus thermoleovorans]TLS34010.1 anti-sigma factor domain-containing protein [Geobacillus thermoleovorans]
MKKGIVLELDEEFVTVLTPEGEFLRLKKEKECEIGEEVKANAVGRPFPFRRRSFRYALISVLTAATVLLATWIQWPSNAVYAYMSIDINPSIEAGVDAELRVLTLKAYNEEGKKVLAALPSWKRQPFSSVTKQIIALSEQKGYLKKGGEVLITTVERERDASSARKLSAALAEIQRSVADDRIVITTANSTMAVRNQAVKRGMTTGKLLQIEKKVKPAAPASVRSADGNGRKGEGWKDKAKGGEKENKMPAVKEQPTQQPSKKQNHNESNPKPSKNEKQPPRKQKHSHPTKGSLSPEKESYVKWKSHGNARPLRPGAHYEKKKGNGGDSGKEGHRRQADVHRHLKAMDAKTKKAE